MGRASRRRAERRAAEQLPAPPTASGRWLPFPAQQELGQLRELREQRAELDLAIKALVVDLTARGVGWGDIGRALDLTRQGARQKYGRPTG